MRRAIILFIVVMAFIGLGIFLNTLAYGIADSEETRIKLLNELEGSQVFQDHRELLMETIEREHEAIFERTLKRSRKGFDWEGYRTTMYFKLTAALTEKGETEAVSKLDQYRAGR
ncbi:MAG: hypothetical protein O7G85_13875 [Planctomycetota bacterium]|nr:hypothetical protein [Planctomycetota bacterium]